MSSKDQNLKDVEVKKQKYFDHGWKLFFILYQICFFYTLAYFSFGFGNPQFIFQPFDADKQACGVDLGLDKFSLIYFAAPEPGYLYRTVCVSDCPMLDYGESDSDETIQFSCYPNNEITVCNNHPSVNYPDSETSVYDSILFRTSCLPIRYSKLIKVLNGTVMEPFSSKLSDFYHAKLVILLSVLICVFLNLFILYILPKYTKQTIYGILFTLFLFLIILSLAGLNYYNQLSMTIIEDRDLTIDEISFIVQTRTVDKNMTLFFVIAPGLVAIYFAIYCFFKRESFKQLHEEIVNAQLYISHYQHTVIYLPILSSFFFIIFFVIWFYVTMYLLSIGSRSQDSNVMPYQVFQTSPLAYILLVFQFAELLFVTAFIFGNEEYILSGLFIKIKDKIKYKKIEQKKTIVDQNQNNVKDDVNKLGQNSEEKQIDQNGDEDIQEVMENFQFYYSGSIFLGQLLIMMHSFISILGLLNIFKCTCYLKWVARFSKKVYIYAELNDISFIEASNLYLTDIEDQKKKGEENIFFQEFGSKFTFFSQLCVSLVCSCFTQILLTSPLYNQMIASPYTTNFLSFILNFQITYIFQSVYGQCIEVEEYIKYQDTKNKELKEVSKEESKPNNNNSQLKQEA